MFGCRHFLQVAIFLLVVMNARFVHSHSKGVRRSKSKQLSANMTQAEYSEQQFMKWVNFVGGLKHSVFKTAKNKLFPSYTLTVDQNPVLGDFTAIQDAIDSLPSVNLVRVVINVHAGTYSPLPLISNPPELSPNRPSPVVRSPAAAAAAAPARCCSCRRRRRCCSVHEMAPRGGGHSRGSRPSSSAGSASMPDEGGSGTPREPAGGRIHVWLEGGILMLAHEIASAITISFKKFLHHESVNWKSVPNETKSDYFAEFEKEFTWDPNLDEVVRQKWAHKAAERYKDMVYRIKRCQDKPVFVGDEVWAAWHAYWGSDAAKEKSRKAAKNRLTEPDGPGTGISTHRGGSRCAQHHAAALMKEKGIPPEQVGWEVFQRLHFPNGEFSNSKSARIAAQVRARADELRQSTPPGTTEEPEVDMTSIYLDVAGVDRKRRVFGLGGMSRALGSSAGGHGSSSQSAVTSQFNDESLNKIVDERVEQKLEERVARMQVDLRAEISAEYDEKLAQLITSLRREFKGDDSNSTP